jgi:hypothetical protein
MLTYLISIEADCCDVVCLNNLTGCNDVGVFNNEGTCEAGMFE